MIETRLLHQFIAVAETLSFHKAAERLFMTQPPLSAAIKRLEAEIGTPLFERNTRAVTLTTAGKAFLHRAYGIMEALDESVLYARRAAKGVEGRVRIGTLSVITYPFLMNAIRAFREGHPNVSCDMWEDSTAIQLDALEKNQVDVCFMRSPGATSPGIRSERIHAEKVMAAVPAGHRFAARKSISLSLLAGEPFVASTRSLGTFHDHARQLCEKAGFSPNVVQTAGRMTSIIGLVASGFGVALVPGDFRDGAPPSVVFLPISVPAGTRLLSVGLYMVHNGSVANPTRDRLMEAVRATALKHPHAE